MEPLARTHDFSLNTPVKDLTKEQLDLLLYGEGEELYSYRNRFGRTVRRSDGFEGVIPTLERLYRDTESEYSRANIERYMVLKPCPDCQGKRLKPESLAVTIGGKNIMDVSGMPVAQSLAWLDEIDANVLTEREKMIAHQILKEIKTRLGFLKDVGLDYLTTDRASMTLSAAASPSASAWPPRSAAA